MHQQQIAVPAPGSPEAVAQGCTCPVMDNGHGRGLFGDGERFGWVMSWDCPLHGTEANKKSGPSSKPTWESNDARTE